MTNRLCTLNSTVNQTGESSENCTNNTTVVTGNPYLYTLEILRIISIICYVLVFLLSTLGNSTIIAIVMRNKSMQSKANVLIINMAISDLLATMFALPRMLDVSITNSHEWKAPSVIAEVACKLGPFVREVSCAVSIFSLVAIAVDRFFAIVVPLVRKPQLLNLRYLIPLIWLMSIGSNALYLYSFQLTIKPVKGLVCFNILTNEQEKIFDSFRFVTFIAVPCLALVNLYSVIAFKMGRRAIPGAAVQSFASNRRQQNKKIIKLAVVIVVFFFLSWSPYYILLLVVIYTWNSQMPPPYLVIYVYVLQEVFTILTYASFAVNPFICIVFSSNFQRYTRRTFYRSHSPATLNFTRTATTAVNQNTARCLSLSNLDTPLGNVMGIENQAHEDKPES